MLLFISKNGVVKQSRPLWIITIAVLSIVLLVWNVISFVKGNFGDHTGVANDIVDLEKQLSKIVGNRGDIETLFRSKSVIPLDGEVHWKVKFSPNGFIINIFGVTSISFESVDVKNICYDHELWNHRCHCGSYGKIAPMLKLVPGWDQEFFSGIDETGILVIQELPLKKNQLQPNLVMYVIFPKTRKFIGGYIHSY